MASNAQGEGGSGGSSSKSKRKNEGRMKLPKVRQRGMGVAQLEHLRIQRQMAASASDENADAGSGVLNNLHNAPMPRLLDEGLGINNPFYPSFLLASKLPSFAHTPAKEKLSFSMPEYDFLHISHPTPSLTPSESHGCEKMNMDSEGSNIQLGRLGTSRLDEEEDDDLEFRQPNYFTRLLLGEDDEEETVQKTKKARTNSSGEESTTPTRSSSSQEPNLKFRIFF